MKFNYQARTKEGKVQSGIVKASSKEAAYEVLKTHGLYVTALEEAVIPIYAQSLKILQRVRKKDVMVFSRQLAIMFKSKVPLAESFRTLTKQTGNVNFKEKILKIAEEVEGGTALSKALALYPKLFSPFYINMVKSGEISGKFTEVFNYLADYLEREIYLNQKIKGAMIYPAFIMVVFFVVVSIVITFIIPQLSEFLKETEQQLPFLTVLVIGTSDFLRAHGLFVILIFILLMISFFIFLKTKRGKTIFDQTLLKIPPLNSFFKKFYLTRFALNLSTLISGGLPIANALKITSDVIGNDVYKKIILITTDEVRKGEKISTVLEKYPELISPLFYQMIVVGEQTGTLDSSLTNVVQFYQKDIDSVTDNFVKLLEPIMIVIIGFLVGILVFAVIMPIYTFTTF